MKHQYMPSCNRASNESTQLYLFAALSESQSKSYLQHFWTLACVQCSGVHGWCALHMCYAVRLILPHDTVRTCGVECAPLGFTGTPVWRALVFNLSKERKAKGFQSPTYIATIAVPSLVPDGKHHFPKTRVPNITCGESCSCRERFPLVVASTCQKEKKHARDFRRTIFSRVLSVFLQCSLSYRSSDQSVHRHAREQRCSLIARATLHARGQMHAMHRP